MSRIEKMNEIRKMCGLEPNKKSFFYREEFVAIAELILGDKVSDDISIGEMIGMVFPNWTNQSTSNNHPSLSNVEYIMDTIQAVQDSSPVELAEKTEDQDRIIGLAEFILRGFKPSFGENILAVSVCADNPKEFTVLLK